MLEVASGNIELGIKYTVSNTVDGTGYITYKAVQYTQGKSFVGQVASDTYTTSDANMKVYGDDAEIEIKTQNTSEVENELSPYPENIQIISQSSGEGFGDEEVIYPESILVKSLLTSEGTAERKPQILNIR
jgi:hypothetical protein